jgi:hypothetical protein
MISSINVDGVATDQCLVSAEIPVLRHIHDHLGYRIQLLTGFRLSNICPIVAEVTIEAATLNCCTRPKVEEEGLVQFAASS